MKPNKFNNQQINSHDIGLISPNSRIPQLNQRCTLGVLASGEGTNFEALAKAISNNFLNANIALLITNKECNAINKAKNLGIPSLTFDHTRYDSRSDYDQLILSTFKSHSVDFIVMAGWMRIVTDNLINNYRDRIINIHPSLLPSFPGSNSISAALKSGVKVTGCTAHIVTKEVDSGPILIQAAVPIEVFDDLVSLSNRIRIYEHKILPIGVGLAISRYLSKDKK